MNKYYFCTKNIAFADCYKNATSLERRNLKRLFLSSRAYDEQKFCDGINFQLSYPRNLQEHDCEKNYVEAKEACESSYVATYLKNKSDESLCRCVLKTFGSFRILRLPLIRAFSTYFVEMTQPIIPDTDNRQTQINQSKRKVKNVRRCLTRGKNTGERL